MQTNLFTKNLDSSEKFPFQAFAVILLSIAFSLAAIHFSPAPKFGFAPSFESIIARFSQNNNSQALALATSIPEELVFDEQATTPGDTVNENANETNLLLAPLGETPPENFARRELKIDSLLSRIAVLTESYAITSQPRFECDYSMAKLNSSLVLSANAKRKTRILVFGDSMIESDYIISALRNTLQRIFGDGGIGFVPANTCDGCKFHGLTVRRSGDWQTYDVFHDFCVDSLYGPSCTFIQAPAGATDLHLFYDKAPTFDNKLMPIDYFSIIYLERPDGGTVELIIDDTLRTDFTTKGSSMQVRRFSVKLARRSHTFIVHPKGDGVARIYGAEFLLGEQGVTVEGISIRGARLDNLDRNRDEHWQQSLELLSPDAVIVFFGANSSGYDTLPAWFKHSSKRTLLALNHILPDSASRVVISTLDRAIRDENGVHTKPVIPELVAAQKFAAQGAGWAFLDAYRALGGEGAFTSWYKLEKPLVSGDLTHLSPKGANIVGNILGIAFLNQLTDYLRSENPVMALPPRRFPTDKTLSTEVIQK